MLDFIGTIVLVAAIIVSINALTGAMPISPSQRLALSVGAGLWTGLAAALATSCSSPIPASRRTVVRRSDSR